MPITIEQALDLTTTTLQQFGKFKFVDLSGDIQNFVVKPLMDEKDEDFDDGKSLQWNVMKDSNGQATNVGLYNVQNYNILDVMTTASVPWRHSQTNWSYDLREVDINGGPSKIVDIVDVRRYAAMLDQAKLFENNFWGKPATSSDSVKPYGVDYYLVYNATEGFNGGLPSGFSDVAGLAPATLPRWANYTGQYTNVTQADLVKLIRTGIDKCMFEPPIDLPTYSKGDPQWGIYTPYSVKQSLENLAVAQNNQLGNDIASKDGITLIRRVPVKWVPKLDGQTTALPVYGINWRSFKITFLKGWKLKDLKPHAVANQPTVIAGDQYSTYNFKCMSRRENFLFAKGALS